MNVLNKTNFYIFTGGPGAGKTTVLHELSKLNYTCISEVARAIIKSQHVTGGHALHTGDRTTYSNLMLQHSIDDFITHADRNDVLFFDRGIPDLYSYLSQYCDGVTPELQEAIKHYRYNTHVFLFPPWPDIYCHDAERKQSLNEAIKTYHSVKTAYDLCGYKTIELPKASIVDRVNFILNAINI
jgi:predicted ATPase